MVGLGCKPVAGGETRASDARCWPAATGYNRVPGTSGFRKARKRSLRREHSRLPGHGKMRRQGAHNVAERAARQRLRGDALIPCEAEIPAEYKNSADWMGRCSAIVGHVTHVTMYQRGVSTLWRRVQSRVKFPATVEPDLPRPRTADERYFGVAYARFKSDASSWDNDPDLSADLVMMPHPSCGAMHGACPCQLGSVMKEGLCRRSRGFGKRGSPATF